jgi:hypothetical protein
MDFVSLLLYCTVAFNLALVATAMFFIRRTWHARRSERARRQAGMLEQGKLITLQQELIQEKEKLLNAYRETN